MRARRCIPRTCCWPDRACWAGGVGAAITDGTGPGPVPCQGCFHWLQPGGQAVVPDYKKGLPDAWWAGAGLCTRFAPSPSNEEGHRTAWRVTNAIDGCGDGAAVR